MRFAMNNIVQAGWQGEKIIRDYLTRQHIHYMQADILAKRDNKWYLMEIKHQEMFERPPFDGHGLPKWQIDARLNFQEDTGIRAMLLIVDKCTGIIYWQYMDELNKGEQYQTNGSKPRLIFPIDNYNILNIE
jgi:hypothetical protein